MLQTLTLIGGRRIALLAFLFSVLSAGAGLAPAQAGPLQPQVRLRGHIPLAAIAQAHLVGRVVHSETVSLSLALPLRDPAGLQNFLSRLYDPTDPAHGHYLTSAQFTQRFSPTAQSYQAVIAFARSRGLTVTNTHPNRLLVDVSGPASTVEAAFGIHLMSYRAADGHAFRAPDAEPLIPAALSGRLSGVIGLNNAAVWKPHFHRLSPRMMSRFLGMQAQGQISAHPSDVGTGPAGGLTPGDIKTAYNLNSVTADGTGRTLALFELDGYNTDDITTYESSFNLPNVPLQVIPVDGYSGMITDPSSAAEVTLDIELMTALAPAAKTILVYETFNDSVPYLDTFSRIASDNSAKEISTSWGQPEDQVDQATRDTENTIFQQFAAQGQSLYAASGDSGAYDDQTFGNLGTLSVDDPASQPFVTGVGGTRLTTSSPGGPYQTEQAWGDTSVTGVTLLQPRGSGGGGGISDKWPLPDYQTGFGLSTTQRNVPDVSLNADPNTGYAIFYNGGFAVYGGTSCAAPLWAAYTALVNQQRATLGQSVLGFPNPTLYRIGADPNYAKAFHDIADGSTNLFYATTPGYDNATGLGTFNGANLLALLASPTNGAANPIASLVLNPAIIVGGLKAQGTVTLASPAPAGGTTVTLTSSAPNTAALPVATVVVPAGGTVATFTVTTVAVTAVNKTIITASVSGGSLTATLTVTPNPGSIAPTSLSFDVAGPCGGSKPVTATLTLNGPAPFGGLVAGLSSDNAAATVPSSVTVLEGATSVTFSVTTTQVAVDTVANISVTANSVTKTAALTVLSPALTRFKLNPGRITGGRQATATIDLTCPALPTGATVTLSSDNSAVVTLPPTVTFPAGAIETSIPISTTTVTSPVTVMITAVFAGVTQKMPLIVQPGGLVGLTVLPTSLTGGASAVGTLALDSAAPPGGLVISLASSDPSTVVPATVPIPAGLSTATFAITTSNVSAPTTATLTATLNGATQTVVLTVLPIRAASLVLNPTRILVGGSATGNLTLSAPAPATGLAVALSTANPTLVTVPTVIVVPAGQTTTTFTVTGILTGTAAVTATVGGQAQTASLAIINAPGTSYPAGLNLISVPYDYTGIPLDTVFGFTGVTLAVWLPSQNQYALTPTSPADTLRPGQGYWVNLPNSLTLTRVGVPTDTTQDFSVSLLPGWNMVGDPFAVPVPLGNTRASNGSVQDPFAQATTGTPLLLSSLVYRYQPAQSGVPGAYLWVRASDFLQPGQGYWVYAYQSVTLTIPHPAP